MSHVTVAAAETSVVEATMRDPDVRALKTGLSAFLIVTAFFSVSVNILLLVSPLYMLQVYDRVLTSGSMETRILISVLAGGLMVTYVFAESARRHALALAARFLHRRFGEKLFNVNFAESRADGSLQKDLSDLTVVQSFFSNGLILPVFDLPFTPCFLLVLYLIHPLLGWLGVAGATLLLLITILAELAAREPEKTAQSVERASQDFASGLAGQQSAIVSMGMARQAFQGWSSRKALADQLSLGTAKSSNFFGALTRGLRQTLQMAALGLGGWLVLQHVATPGVIIAGSIVMGRALAPIDQCVGMWRQIIRARKSWKNVRQRAANPLAEHDEFTPMPRPEPRLELVNLEVGHPGAEQRVLPRFSLTLEGGTVLAIVGPSGIGKSTLLQTLTGVWLPLDGQVTLGGRDLHEWNQNDRGQYVGYLPQDVELLTLAAHGHMFKIDPQTNELQFESAPDYEAPAAAYEYDSVVEFHTGLDRWSIRENAEGTRIITEDHESNTGSFDGILTTGEEMLFDGNGGDSFVGYVTIDGHTMIVTSSFDTFSGKARYQLYVPAGVDPDSLNLPDDFDLSSVNRSSFELPTTNEYVVIVEAEEGGRKSTQTITITVEDVDETPMPAAAANSGDLVDLLDNLESEVVSTPTEPDNGKTSPPIMPVAPQLTPDWWPQDELVSTLSHLDMSDALDGF